MPILLQHFDESENKLLYRSGTYKHLQWWLNWNFILHRIRWTTTIGFSFFPDGVSSPVGSSVHQQYTGPLALLLQLPFLG